MPEPDETPVEPKQCPRGHGPMRIRVRWGSSANRPGRQRARGLAIREWQCPVCGRTVPVEE